MGSATLSTLITLVRMTTYDLYFCLLLLSDEKTRDVGLKMMYCLGVAYS